MQPVALVTEKQLLAAVVHFQPVNLRVVLNARSSVAGAQIQHINSVQVNHVGQLFLRRLVAAMAAANTDAEQVWIHVLCACGAQNLVDAVLHHRQLASGKYQAAGRMLKVELFRTSDCRGMTR